MRSSMQGAAAHVFGAVAGICIFTAPVAALAQEARVLILNGLDPYLPAYLAIDSAMRASLAGETARRIVLYSEPLDAQRFAVESLEPETLALLTKKYRSLNVDVVVTVTKPAPRGTNTISSKASSTDDIKTANSIFDCEGG